MLRTAAKCCGAVGLLLVACATELCAQKAPYDVFPPVEAPYHRVRYETSDKPGDLSYAALPTCPAAPMLLSWTLHFPQVPYGDIQIRPDRLRPCHRRSAA
jgi:hypothetical protein